VLAHINDNLTEILDESTLARLAGVTPSTPVPQLPSPYRPVGGRSGHRPLGRAPPSCRRHDGEGQGRGHLAPHFSLAPLLPRQQPLLMPSVSQTGCMSFQNFWATAPPSPIRTRAPSLPGWAWTSPSKVSSLYTSPASAASDTAFVRSSRCSRAMAHRSSASSFREAPARTIWCASFSPIRPACQWSPPKPLNPFYWAQLSLEPWLANDTTRCPPQWRR